MLTIEQVLHGFNPHLLKLRLCYEVFCIIICLSVFIVEELTTEWYWYFILYSYWAVTISFITFVNAAISTIMRLKICQDDNLLRNKRYIWWLNLIDISRDVWIVLSLIQTAISSLAFWCFTKPAWSIGYPSLVAHTLIVILLFFLFCFTITHISWWSLILSLFYAGSYYCFTLMYYLVYRYWAYTLEDPSYTDKWYYLAIISTVLQFLFYFIIGILNHLKEHIYFNLYQKYPCEIIYDRIIFATRRKEYLKSEILFALVTISFIEIYSGIITIISIYMIINEAFTILLAHIIFECFICVFVLIALVMAFEYIFYDGTKDSLSHTKTLAVVVFLCYCIRIVFGVVMIYIYNVTDIFWIYCSVIMMTAMLLLTTVILFYFLRMSKDFTEEYDPIINFE
jgi:hypothetical protein